MEADKLHHGGSDSDEFNPRAGKKEEKDALLGNDRHTVHALLNKIQTPWSSTFSQDGPSGMLMKEKRRFGAWGPYFCVMRNNRLEWYSKQGDPKPAGSLSIVFASLEDFTQIEKENMSNQQNVKLAKQRLTVFATDQMAFFACADEGLLKEFFAAMQKLLVTVLGQAEYDKRADAARALIPLIDKRYLEETKRAEEMMKCLMDQGLLTNPKPPLKQGYLWMAIDGDMDDWKKLYFTLEPDFLNYRHSKKEMKSLEPGERFKASIGLKYARVQEAPADPKHPHLFHLITPYVTYYLRAKHEVALIEWLQAIDKVFPKKKRTGAGQGAPGSPSHGVELQPVGGSHGRPAPVTDDVPTAATVRYIKPRLEWTDSKSGKHKSEKIEKAKTTLGRSSANDLRVYDKSISRAHARIDWKDNLCIISDLGSSLGTQVNGQLVAKKILQPGDQILLGKLPVSFVAQARP